MNVVIRLNNRGNVYGKVYSLMIILRDLKTDKQLTVISISNT